jgi:TRAP-type mannitol/chloroaromatic compound transport system permease small subunit
MNAISARHVVMALIATPFLAFGAYVAWLVVPIVIREAVPVVIRAVINS